SPDGKTVVYTRRVSGHEKIFVFPLDNPDHKTQLTFGAHDDDAPSFSPDGQLIFYSSTEDDEIYNRRSLDLRTGIIRQYTDALGGQRARGVGRAGGGRRGGFHESLKGGVPPADDRAGGAPEGGRAGGAHRQRRDARLPAGGRAPGGGGEQAQEEDVREAVPGG